VRFPAFIAAKFNIFPIALPFFTPGKGPAAGEAGFLWQMGFLDSNAFIVHLFFHLLIPF
jgi:hypothetical protein